MNTAGPEPISGERLAESRRNGHRGMLEPDSPESAMLALDAAAQLDGAARRANMAVMIDQERRKAAARVAVVVPSNRPDQLRAFLDAWRPALPGVSWYFVGPESGVGIDAGLGDDAWIISRHDSAIRSFGFWQAWREGCDLILTLDDDTRPVAGVDHLAGHRAALDATPRWRSTLPDLVPRGMPYGDRGTLPGVMISVGLWRGVPDLDAARTLVQGIPSDYEPPPGRWIVPRGQYFPLCGMNLAARREAIPLLYMGLQGPPWPMGRHDDIYCGVVAKRICDHLGWSISVGEPHVTHIRASDPFANIAREAPGLALNERLWRLVDSAPLRGDTAASCMAEVGGHLERTGDTDYLRTLGRALRAWAGLFDPHPEP